MLEGPQESDNDRKSFEEAMGLGSMPNVEPQQSPRSAAGGLFGMSATQRFIVAVLLLVAVCGLGAMCLLITGRISLF